MSLRGILRGFGQKVGHTTPRSFEARVRELVEGHPTLTTIADALLAARSVLHREFQGFERQVRSLARRDDRTRLLMSAPGVGVLVSLTYASAIDDPARFKRSRQVGAHFGLTPKRYQSGEKDVSGRISKIGDRGVRTVLYEAAHIILTRPVKAGALKSWAMRLAARAGKNKAKVALERDRLVASGQFIHANPSDPIHYGSGKVSVYSDVVFLEQDFEVGPGPAFHVYLVPKASIRKSGDVEDTMFVDLGKLRAFRGGQKYPIPAGVNLGDFPSVVIWCRQFGVLISPADLTFEAGA